MRYLALLFFMLTWMAGHPQDSIDSVQGNAIATLFQDHQPPLALRLRFSSRELRRETNDSTYSISSLSYKKPAGTWDSLEIKLRARGNYRRNNCNYVPLKVKLSTSVTRGTIFEGNKKLKIVLPCLIERNNNDLVLKEYMAYKFFELISPYHYRTRLATIEFEDEGKSRTREHELKGILVEDIEKVAERFNGKVMKKKVHPVQQDDLSSLQNALFEYMIGNTDYSTRGQHNEKLVYVDGKYVSIPFDFDMSGLVNANYATISGLENTKAIITQVTERVYKGYKRDDNLLQQVRNDFLEHKNDVFDVMESLKGYFDSPAQFNEASEFVADFFRVLADDKKFQRNIVDYQR